MSDGDLNQNNINSRLGDESFGDGQNAEPEDIESGSSSDPSAFEGVLPGGQPEDDLVAAANSGEALRNIMDGAEVSMSELTQYQLTPDEIDVLGEIGNICMGAAATTLYTLFDRPVNITTPEVRVHSTRKIWDQYNLPFVAVVIGYIEGVLGKNVLLLKENDVRLMTNLLMGGDGDYDPSEELGELHLSAISEIMNQMMGASSTSLASMIGTTVNITPPDATIINFGMDSIKSLMDLEEVFVNVGFKMEIEGLLSSEIFQMMSFEFAKQVVSSLSPQQTEQAEEPPPAVSSPRDTAAPQDSAPRTPPIAPQQHAQPDFPPQHTQPGYPQQYAQPDYPPQHAQPGYPPQYAQPGYPPHYAQPGYPPPQYVPPQQQRRNMTPPEIQPLQYTKFDEPANFNAVPAEPIDLLFDVPLQVSVELGRAKRSIREILDFNIGSLIVLDKLSGEPVDVMVNGKLIAKGEVVVIDESYGVRITEIITPSKRLSQLT